MKVTAKDVASLTDDALDVLAVSLEEHDLVYDTNDDGFDSFHLEHSCSLCVVTSEKNSREYKRDSKKPGHLPLITNSISKSIDISELREGDYAKYLSRPGVSRYPYEYAECLKISFDANISRYQVEWRKTNSDEESFKAIYEEKDTLEIARSIFIAAD